MIIFLLALATLGSAVLAPIIAGFIVLLGADQGNSRAAAWLGLSIGIGTASTLPSFAVYLAVAGQAWGYRLAPALGFLAFLLGARIFLESFQE